MNESKIEKDLKDYIKYCETNKLQAKDYKNFKYYMDNVYDERKNA